MQDAGGVPGEDLDTGLGGNLFPFDFLEEDIS